MAGGPGRAERQGLTLAELFRTFPGNVKAEAWFAAKRWPDGARCPHCDHNSVQSGAKHPTMPYRCRACRKRFSVKTGTVMESSNLSYQTWAIAVYRMTTSLRGVSSMQLHRDLGITQKAAWHLAHRIRQAFMDPADHRMQGPVEVDETYMGGKEKNKRKSKRLHAGTGGTGKQIVAGIKDRATNQVTATVIPAVDGRTLSGYIGARIQGGAMAYTDEHAGYRHLRNHAMVRHSVGEYVRDQAHTNGIEGFWSQLKRGYHGTYSHWSTKHTGRYLDEFTGRYNARSQDTVDQMAGIAKGMVGKRLRYRELIA